MGVLSCLSSKADNDLRVDTVFCCVR